MTAFSCSHDDILELWPGQNKRFAHSLSFIIAQTSHGFARKKNIR